MGLSSTIQGNQNSFIYLSKSYFHKTIHFYFRTCPVSNIVRGRALLVIFCEFRLRHGKNVNI